MRVDILTLFPQMFSALNHSIVGKAQDKKALSLYCHNLRDFSANKHGTVDDTPYGGEAGMVLQAEPIKTAISTISKESLPDQKPHMLYLCPQGKIFDQKKAKELAKRQNILIICGHYKGIDERIREKYVDEEISVGDFVLTGGEIPAMVLVDSVARLLPGVLGGPSSMETDSFYEDGRLGWPVYTRPETFEGNSVPEVLMSGNHEKIRQWQILQGLKETRSKRPDLWESLQLNEEEKILLSRDGSKEK
jgi:tRNA (guanine37-N1)-methyltransferase